jgi:hypothetical protein
MHGCGADDRAHRYIQWRESRIRHTADRGPAREDDASTASWASKSTTDLGLVSARGAQLMMPCCAWASALAGGGGVRISVAAGSLPWPK